MTSRQQSTVSFGGLQIAYDERVLTPRSWTEAQSRWASDLARTAPPGPVLELCAGAGQIGLLAVSTTDRHLVCVDSDPTAVEYAVANVARAGMEHRVEVRHLRLEEALDADERFPVIIADPPWVTSTEVGAFPEDPVTAIDGGPQGLDVARACVSLIGEHLVVGGSAVLQLGSASQVEALSDDISRAGLHVAEVRPYDPRGALVLLRHAAPRPEAS